MFYRKGFEMLSKEKLSKMLLRMHQIRYFEEKVEQLYREGLVKGGIHFYIGEEAVAIGACSAVKSSDYIVSTHRGHGHCIAKGGDLNKMMAELLGRERGYCKGRGGSMHLADSNIGLLGCSGIVGGGIPIAVGAAFSSYYRESGQVALSFFGDGASNQGVFHESLNLAALWKLPVIFICESNLYAISVPASKSTSVKDIADRSAGYGIPGEIVDGMNAFNVYESVNKAVERARNGDGPSLIECKTYRFKGHWVNDPQVYRTQEEVEEWKKKDPISLFTRTLKQKHGFTDESLNDIEKQAHKDIEMAASFAKSCDHPRAVDVDKYIYSEK